MIKIFKIEGNLQFSTHMNFDKYLCIHRYHISHMTGKIEMYLQFLKNNTNKLNGYERMNIESNIIIGWKSAILFPC